MRYFEIQALTAIGIGATVHLTDSQAAARKHAVAPVPGKPNLFKVSAPTQFKKGEILGTDFAVGKSTATELEAGAAAFERLIRQQREGARAERSRQLGERKRRADAEAGAEKRSQEEARKAVEAKARAQQEAREREEAEGAQARANELRSKLADAAAVVEQAQKALDECKDDKQKAELEAALASASAAAQKVRGELEGAEQERQDVLSRVSAGVRAFFRRAK